MQLVMLDAVLCVLLMLIKPDVSTSLWISIQLVCPEMLLRRVPKWCCQLSPQTGLEACDLLMVSVEFMLTSGIAKSHWKLSGDRFICLRDRDLHHREE